jgi:hypothetical protein
VKRVPGKQAIDNGGTAVAPAGNSNAAEEELSTPNAIAESARDMAPLGPRRWRNDATTGQPDPEAGFSTPNAIAQRARETPSPGRRKERQAEADEEPR